MADALESQLQRRIVDALRSLGVWVIRTGVNVKRGQRGTQSGEPGMPDLWTPYGWLEVKLPGEALSPKQIAWHEKAKRHGVRVWTVDTEREAVSVVLSWRAAA